MPTTPTQTPDTLAGQLGFAAAFFNSVPELKTLLAKALKEKWTADRFKAEFMKSKWYRTNQATIRQWQELKTRDPATAEAQINDRVFQIQQQASQMGITIDAGRAKQLAEQSIMFGYSDEYLTNAIASEWHYQEGQTAGNAAAVETQIEAMAYNMGVDVSNQQMQDWISGVLSGKYTQATLEDYIRDMGKSKYQGMAGLIDAGMNVRQIASPYLQSYANTLEVNPDTIDLNDPTIARALQGSPNSQGQVETQSLWQFEKSLKKDPRWLKTTNAHKSMTDLALRIGQDMGLYA